MVLAFSINASSILWTFRTVHFGSDIFSPFVPVTEDAVKHTFDIFGKFSGQNSHFLRKCNVQLTSYYWHVIKLLVAQKSVSESSCVQGVQNDNLLAPYHNGSCLTQP